MLFLLLPSPSRSRVIGRASALIEAPMLLAASHPRDGGDCALVAAIVHTHSPECGPCVSDET